MRINLVIVTLLCFITWKSFVHATHGRASSCCLDFSTTKVKLDKIVNYTSQSDSNCAIKAIVFVTELGKSICSNPNSKWTKKAILKVDRETQALQMKGNNEEGSTSDITPTVSSTSKNAAQRRTRSGKRRVTKARKVTGKCV